MSQLQLLIPRGVHHDFFAKDLGTHWAVETVIVGRLGPGCIVPQKARLVE